MSSFGPGPTGPAEGSGFSHGKTSEFGDRHILGPMIFGPGSGASGALVQANEAQKAVMDKDRDTGDYKYLSQDEKRRMYEYDNQPEVQQRRWESMRWSTKLMLMSPKTNHALFWMWNACVFAVVWRMNATSIKQTLRWSCGFGIVGYFMFMPPELK